MRVVSLSSGVGVHVLAVCLSLSLAAPVARGELEADGDVSPADPSTWPDSSLYVGEVGTGSITVDNDSDLLSRNGILGYQAGSSGTVSIQGAGSTWTDLHRLYVGDQGTGLLQIHDGGEVQVQDTTYVGMRDGLNGRIDFDQGTLNTGGLLAAPGQLTGTGTVNTRGLVSDVDLIFDATHPLGSTITLDGLPDQNITINLGSFLRTFGVGYLNDGAVRVADGVQLRNFGDAHLGYFSGSSGVATVTGAGSAWTTGFIGTFYVGREGSGRLDVVDGAVVWNMADRGVIHVGAMAGSQGEVNVSGTDSRITMRDIRIGDGGEGLAVIREGGLIQAESFHLGIQASGLGSVHVLGAESALEVDGQLVVGKYGSGQVLVAEGAQLSSDGAAVGSQSQGVGAVTITGADSHWDSQGTILLGNAGEGTLTIAEGGSVVSEGGANIGNHDGSSGLARVSGENSSWQVSQMVVGSYGSGRLEAADSASITTTWDLTIGKEDSATGVADVRGANTTMDIGGNLIIADHGAGELRIADGATVTVANNTTVGRYNDTACSIQLDDATLVTAGLFAASDQVLGVGTIYAHGMTIDADLLFDPANGEYLGQCTLSQLPDQDIAIYLKPDGTTSLHVGHTLDATSVMRNGAAVTNTSAYIGIDSTATGELSVQSGANWNLTQGLIVADHGHGTLDISGGAAVQVAEQVAIAQSNDGIGTLLVTGTGSTLQADSLNVGDKGTGSMVISDGASVDISWATVGAREGASGVVTVTGPLTRLEVTSINVGYEGEGTLRIVDGATVQTGSMRVQSGQTGLGHLDFDGGTLDTSVFDTPLQALTGTGTVLANHLITDVDLVFDADHGLNQTLTLNGAPDRDITVHLDQASNQTMYAGYHAAGSLTVQDGLVLESDGGLIGFHEAAVGLATICGPGTQWNNTGSVHVGYRGSGQMRILDGAQVSSSYGYVAGQSTGHVLVDGPDSQWSMSDKLHIASAGQATIDITNGGHISSGIGVLASGDQNSEAVVNISGDGSILEISDSGRYYDGLGLVVGQRGQAQINISDGGELQTTAFSLGDHPGGRGTIIVEGSGSRLYLPILASRDSPSYIGRMGYGRLVVADGAVAEIESVGTVLWDNMIKVGQEPGAEGSIHLDDGTLITPALHAALSDLTGTGTIQTQNLVSDMDMVLDPAHGLKQTFVLDGQPDRNITVHLDQSLELGAKLVAGYAAEGSLAIEDFRLVSDFLPIIAGEKAGSNGSIEIRGEGAWVDVGWGVTIGQKGSGTLVVAEGATLLSRLVIASEPGSAGQASFADPGTFLQGDVSVGAHGAGTLDLHNGVKIEGEEISIGIGPEAVGVLTIHDAACSVSTYGELYVASQGQGTLNMLDGAVVRAEWTSVGFDFTDDGTNPSGQGHIHFEDGATLHTDVLYANPSDLSGNGVIYTHRFHGDVDLLYDATDDQGQILHFNDLPDQDITVHVDPIESSVPWKIGVREQGSVTVRNGAVIDVPGFRLGENIGSTGKLIVDGPGSILHALLTVGHYGSGQASITNGATVSTTGSCFIAQEAQSQGQVIVDGPGSLMQVNNLYVGSGGDGELQITDGGRVECDNAYAAYSGHDVAKVVITVDGEDSTWLAQNISLGWRGDTVMQVSNGGRVESEHYFAFGPGDYDHTDVNSHLLVTGPGSSAEAATELTITRNATLAIRDAGQVTAGQGSIRTGGRVHLRIDDNAPLIQTTGNWQMDGQVRMLAGLSLDAGVYTPISVGDTWSGSGEYRAFGGVWDEVTHSFTVADRTIVDSGQSLGLDLSSAPRVTVMDPVSGRNVQLSFAALETTIDLTSTALTDAGDLEELTDQLTGGQQIVAAWQFDLSLPQDVQTMIAMQISEDFDADTLMVWHRDSPQQWTLVEPTDAYYADGWMHFQVNSFSDYAVTGVPEPTTISVLAAGLLGTLARRRGIRHRAAAERVRARC